MPADAFDDFAEQLEAQRELGRNRRLQPHNVVGTQLVDPDGNALLNFGGNDYLGLVADGLAQSPTSEGSATVIPAGGATASALVCGWSAHHDQLAESIAKLEQTESAVVFPTGYAACSGTIATLCRKGDLLISEQLNHASLIDGCRLSQAERLVFPHRDTAFVADALQQHRSRFNRAWIVTDSVFSMDGDVAPLAELAEIAEQFDATLIVDEAHGTGVLGDQGGGLCEALELHQRVPVRIGTLSKAIGHHGGFVAGPKVVTDFLVQNCRSLIYSTALPPRTAATSKTVIDRLPELHPRREHVAHLSREMRGRLGISTSTATSVEEIESGIPIIPILIGSDADTVRLSNELRSRGYFVPAIRPPTVAEGTARLRVSLSAAHSMEQVTSLCDHLAQLRSKFTTNCHPT